MMSFRDVQNCRCEICIKLVDLYEGWKIPKLSVAEKELQRQIGEAAQKSCQAVYMQLTLEDVWINQ